MTSKGSADLRFVQVCGFLQKFTDSRLPVAGATPKDSSS